MAMTPNTAAVPPNASITRLAPLLMPSTKPSSRDSIRPMKKVKASSRPTPIGLFLNFSIANMKPKAMARKAIRPIKGLPRKKVKPVLMPIQAPMTVGIIDRASSQ